MSQGLFRIIMSTIPATRINGVIDLEEYQKESTLHLEEIVHSKTGVPIGIRTSATVESNSLEQAISIAERHTKGIMSVISYLTSVALPAPRIECAYDVTPGRTEGQFRQYLYNLPIEPVSNRDLDSKEFIKALQNLDSSRMRVARAAAWYQKGLQSSDAIERFTFFWIGLESINPLLSKKRKTGEGLTGVKKVLGADFDAMRKLRVEIVHGFESLTLIQPKATLLAPKAEVGLASAIDQLLGVSGRPKERIIISDSLAITRIDSTIIGPDLSAVDALYEPQISFTYSNVSVTTQDGKSHTVKFDSDGKRIIHPDFSFQEIQITLLGTKNVVKNAEVRKR